MMNLMDVINYQRINKRPSIHGKILNKYNGIKREEYIIKGYMKKRGNVYRKNCYLTTPFVISQINYYSYKLFGKRKKRENVYYSGYFEDKDFFYEKSYKEFQQKLLSDYASFKYFLKIDAEDFYKNISLVKLREFKIEEINEVLNLFERIELDEFPIFEDCAGLSYISTEIYLEELDKKIGKYFSQNYSEFRMIRYSDDLYVFFNEEHNKEKTLFDLKKLYHAHGLKINEGKYVSDYTVNLPNHVNGKLYDLWVNDKDFDLHDIIGSEEEVIKKIEDFILDISLLDGENFSDYEKTLAEKFEISYGNDFRKNIFDEIVYNPKIRRIMGKIDMSAFVTKEKMVELLRLDPIKLTVLFLNYRKKGYPVHILHSIYNFIEKEKPRPSEFLILFTYYTQRSVELQTKEKIINKLSKNSPKLATYLSDYT